MSNQGGLTVRLECENCIKCDRCVNLANLDLVLRSVRADS